jgi:hypothetical protein
MLELKEFFHLSELKTALETLARESAGLVIVAGYDPRSVSVRNIHDTPLP